MINLFAESFKTNDGENSLVRATFTTLFVVMHIYVEAFFCTHWCLCVYRWAERVILIANLIKVLGRGVLSRTHVLSKLQVSFLSLSPSPFLYLALFGNRSLYIAR